MMSGKPRVLDLFCGAGGAARGYQRAGFYVVGVDNKPQPHYAGDEFIQADALEYGAAHGAEFDAIHASPPCQKYSAMQNVNAAQGRKNNHPDLIPETRRILEDSSKPFVIENVQGAPLRTQFILCGHSLGLVRLARHRHFESNVFVPRIKCTHRCVDGLIGVYGKRSDGHRTGLKRYKLNITASSIDEARAAMGIDWMTWDELREAIPPAYTEYIGRYLLSRVLEIRGLMFGDESDPPDGAALKIVEVIE